MEFNVVDCKDVEHVFVNYLSVVDLVEGMRGICKSLCLNISRLDRIVLVRGPTLDGRQV